ncbi:FGGY-family carbohydrate kinase [Robiginitalea sediminis]|uniref:FGGY-family carbohydrate kinase n=1 Tax=Robiginitalea sediminis TaxID=1982593 RepID=UPI000B4C0AF2|nr:FGGY family carbohydrate kinase [Robiginitalea sediminis]
MGVPVTAIFDIGKTNKKFFLFDADFAEVHRTYAQLPQTQDEDRHPTEDLPALIAWMQETLKTALQSSAFEIRALNFSSYGASLVHLDGSGQVLTPLYNYTKPYPPELEQAFYDQYGPQEAFWQATGSDRAGMLNSGLQLYWLKHRHPEVFGRIRTSLHLPQYLTYIFTGKAVSEFTSIGCHTALWDYRDKKYPNWVAAEGLETKLAPIVPHNTSYVVDLSGKELRVGIGIHDSSAALLPYLKSLGKPFVLLSTGTWSIAMNPFSDGPLSARDIEADCIRYMQPDGSPVLASRLFLGNEYKLQVRELNAHYGAGPEKHRNIGFSPELYRNVLRDFRPAFRWVSLPAGSCPERTTFPHSTYEGAYHQLLYELCLLQAGRIRHVIGDTGIRRVYVDGGFAANEVFMEILSQMLRPVKLRTTDASLGSALGAAVAVTGAPLHKGFLKEHYAMKKHKPLILS